MQLLNTTQRQQLAPGHSYHVHIRPAWQPFRQPASHSHALSTTSALLYSLVSADVLCGCCCCRDLTDTELLVEPTEPAAAAEAKHEAAAAAQTKAE